VIAGYLSMTTGRAVAIVSGQVDTVPLWDAPAEELIGCRVAIFAAWVHLPEVMNLIGRGVRMKPDDLRRHGRIGTVELLGYLQTESHTVRRKVSSRNWPAGKKCPHDAATCHWLVGAPKVEMNGSIVGLQRLGMAYADRPEVIRNAIEYGDRFGRACLPADCLAMYDNGKGKDRRCLETKSI
jgi:hypothetical protein